MTVYVVARTHTALPHPLQGVTVQLEGFRQRRCPELPVRTLG
jgi:hypothetical protein